MDNRLTAQQWTSRDGGALDRWRPSEEAVRTLISWKAHSETIRRPVRNFSLQSGCGVVPV